MSYFYIVFSSKCDENLAHANLLDILNKDGFHHRRLGIKSTIVHKKGQLLQILEGQKAVVLSHFSQGVMKSSTHKDINVLVSGFSDELISTSALEYRHKNSPYAAKFKPLFKANFDFSVLKGSEAMLFTLFKDLNTEKKAISQGFVNPLTKHSMSAISLDLLG